MTRGVRRAVRSLGAGVIPAALLMGLVTGCSFLRSEPEPDATVSPSGSADKGARPAEAGGSGGSGKGVAKGGTVGGGDSPCRLPVTFDLAEDWKPAAVDQDAEFGLTDVGTVSLVCEIDAKPAGSIGYLRVWTGDRKKEDPRAALKAFIAENAKSRKGDSYRETQAGPYDAVELRYVNTNELLEEPKKERALAFTTPRGVMILDLGGLDTQEHEAMVPAYELARKSISEN